MSKEEFDRKVQENPANNHLKVKVSDIKDNTNEELGNIEENVKEEISLSIEEEPEVQEENIVPVFEKKKSNKIRSFDIHPEIPTSDRNQFKITNDNLGEGSPREKFNNNVEAIRVLKKCEDITREFVEFCNQPVITLDDVINGNYTVKDIQMLNTAERYATTMGLTQVDDDNLEKVRGFVKELGAEFGTIFDALWTHGDESKLERLAEAKLAEMPGGGIRR